MPNRFERLYMSATRATVHPMIVTGAIDVTPHYRRLACQSPTLLANQEIFPTLWARIWVPGAGGTARARAFTLVDPDPLTGTFGLEIVVHEPSGPGGRWAADPPLGTPLDAAIFGCRDPLPSHVPAGYLLVGDAASLPAINSLLESIPTDVPVSVWFEEANPGDSQLAFRRSENIDINRTTRRGASSGLVAALRHAQLDLTGWHAWIATEIKVTADVRKHLQSAAGLKRSSIHAQGYWRHGRAMGSADDSA